MKSLREVNLLLKKGKVQDNKKVQTMIREIIEHKGKLCAMPDFGKKRVKLYPIPDSLQDTAKHCFSVGDKIKGTLGRIWYTNKKDSSGGGKPIYVQYFVPTEILGNVA